MQSVHLFIMITSILSPLICGDQITIFPFTRDLNDLITALVNDETNFDNGKEIGIDILMRIMKLNRHFKRREFPDLECPGKLLTILSRDMKCHNVGEEIGPFLKVTDVFNRPTEAMWKALILKNNCSGLNKAQKNICHLTSKLYPPDMIESSIEQCYAHQRQNAMTDLSFRCLHVHVIYRICAELVFL